jgi:hypothetical protein
MLLEFVAAFRLPCRDLAEAMRGHVTLANPVT